MKEKIELRLMFWFTIINLTIFTILSVIKQNYEFLYYTFILSVLILIIVLYHKKIHLTKHILLGLTILGAMHLFGTRLYDIWFIPNILKYDNIVHAFGVFVATFVVYNFLRPHLDRKIKHNSFLLSMILILIAMGIGAFNEILELGAVVFLGASKQVGDYMNNALDLVFNLAGSIIASIVIVRYHKKK